MASHCKMKYQTSILTGVKLETTNKECKRPVYRDGLCICHFDDPNKSLQPLIDDIYRMSETNEVDCSYFVFPKEPFRYPNAIRKPLLFEHAKFYGEVSFKGLSFAAYTSFHSAQFFGIADFSDDGDPYNKQTTFQGEINFSSVQFHKDALFRACIFGAPPEFDGTIFRETANFAMAQITYTSESSFLEFRQVEFRKHAYLDFRINGKIPGIAFRFCDLTGLLISSLPRNQTPIIFEEIKKWNEIKKWYQAKRKKIRDEELFKDNTVTLVDTYRYLEKYFYEHSDFSLASNFYVGQMVALQRDKNRGAASKILNILIVLEL